MATSRTPCTGDGPGPTLPTAAEVGLAQLESMDWFALFARTGTSPAKVAEWSAMVGKVLADPKYSEAIRGMGYGVPVTQAADFTKVLTDERAVWTARVRLTGFTAAD